ncbi:MAG: hypothetical protein ACJAQ3_003595 [Planctomycetota bacterium]
MGAFDLSNALSRGFEMDGGKYAAVADAAGTSESDTRRARDYGTEILRSRRRYLRRRRPSVFFRSMAGSSRSERIASSSSSGLKPNGPRSPA